MLRDLKIVEMLNYCNITKIQLSFQSADSVQQMTGVMTFLKLLIIVFCQSCENFQTVEVQNMQSKFMNMAITLFNALLLTKNQIKI